VRPAELGSKSLKLEFEMRVGGRLLAEGYGVLVGFDYATQETVAIPEQLCAKMRTYAQRRN
jgi:acyl-CoA thioester hydrolase